MAAAGAQQCIGVELFLLSLAFKHHPSLSFSPWLPRDAGTERRGLLENTFHKTILKAETAQVRELMCLDCVHVCLHLWLTALK